MISVIIPTYKDDIRLNKCLKSLYEQTLDFSQFEVIVVNNFPEEMIKIKERGLFGLNFRFISEVLPGSYAARNRGIKEAMGDILAFTDSDCLPDKNWLKNAKKFFEKDKTHEIGILTGPVSLFYKDPKKLSPAEIYEKYTAFHTESYAKDGHAVTANWFSYHAVIREFGGFNTKLKSNGDSELSGQISKKYKVVYSSEINVHHPARYHSKELVQKYKRRIGGTYSRMYEGKHLKFAGYIFSFMIRRYRFALKKIFTVPTEESLPILWICHIINMGAFKEFFHLIGGGESKRL
jgi:glycosyltransferase involved in cell wall biosynthesis